MKKEIIEVVWMMANVVLAVLCACVCLDARLIVETPIIDIVFKFVVLGITFTSWRFYLKRLWGHV